MFFYAPRSMLLKIRSYFLLTIAFSLIVTKRKCLTYDNDSIGKSAQTIKGLMKLPIYKLRMVTEGRR